MWRVRSLHLKFEIKILNNETFVANLDFEFKQWLPSFWWCKSQTHPARSCIVYYKICIPLLFTFLFANVFLFFLFLFLFFCAIRFLVIFLLRLLATFTVGLFLIFLAIALAPKVQWLKLVRLYLKMN